MKHFLKTYGPHLILFIITLVCTTLAGAEWRYGRLWALDGLSWKMFFGGLAYSLPLLTFLTFHEFGHYITARLNKVKASLPYYIPLWLPIGLSIGTMGAVIRLKEKLKSRQQFFDIGIAGPLAGFVIALGILYYGFTHLPDHHSLIFDIHPEYKIEYVLKFFFALAVSAGLEGQAFIKNDKELKDYIDFCVERCLAAF